MKSPEKAEGCAGIFEICELEQARNRRERSDRLQIRDYGHLNELVDRSERGDQDQNE